MNKFQDKLVSKFKFYEANLNGEKKSPIFKVRKDAFETFEKNGIPTVRNEDWKYTNLSFLNKLDFNLEPTQTKIYEEQINEFTLPGAGKNRIVLVNGHYNEEFSNLENDTIEIKPFSLAHKENKEDLENHFGKYLNNQKLPFAALNTALAHEGVFIKVAKNTENSEPIQILNIIDASKEPTFINSRNLIIAEESSKVHIYNRTATIGSNDAVYNVSTEFYLAENSNVNYYNYQNDTNHSYVINNSSAYQSRDSVFTDFTITLDGRFVRNDLRTKLDDKNIESNYWGLYILNENQHVDNHTFVDHAKPHCQSNEYYKGILDGKSKGVFNGKVYVAKDAQKTDAYQQNRNLVLSDFASMNTKPELEIYADDVKCSHGATTGRIDEAVLFYMRQRGISEKEARAIIQYVFAMEIVEKITIDKLREFIGNLVMKKLGVEL